jgi:uncharacterized membrane protein YeaQ/YmgE (transglycosylase-associated protein family)
MLIISSICFGLVIGWVTYRTLRRNQTNGLSDVATILGAVGGAAITTLFPSGTEMFSYYCIGLAIGFFTYLIVAGIIVVRSEDKPKLRVINEWLGSPNELYSQNVPKPGPPPITKPNSQDALLGGPPPVTKPNSQDEVLGGPPPIVKPLSTDIPKPGAPLITKPK